MTSTHQHHSSVSSRYSLPPPPQSAQNDFRLPSLKDLNFQYRSPQGNLAPPPTSAPENLPPQPEQSSATRHASSWARSNTIQASSAPSQPHPHQQHTPPLSAGAHEMSASSRVDYSSKQDNGGYVQPGLPLSAQVTPIPGSVNIVTSRGEEQSHSPNQPKRQRPSSTTMSVPRDVRTSHPGYGQAQYGPYPPPSQAPTSSPYHQIPAGLPAPANHPTHPTPAPPHDQIQHHAMPVSTHSNYPGYQYMPPRPPVMQSQSQHPAHPSQNSSNPYPSPGPPPTAPPPQGPWAQAHPAHHPPQHQHQQQQQQQQQQQPHHHASSHPSHHQLPPPTQQSHQHVQHIQPQGTQQQPSVSMPSAPSHFAPQHPPQPPNPNPHYQAPQQHPQQQQYQHHTQQSQQQPAQQQQQHQQPNQPHQQQQQQQQPLPFARTTAIVPTNLDTRGPYANHESERAPSARADAMSEIAGHCNALYSFANRYAQTQSTTPHVQPTSAELEEMSHRAATVVRLLEELRRMNFPEAKHVRVASDTMQQSPEDSRPPKRPWEDISQEDGVPASDPNPYNEQYSSAAAKTQTTAEQDMELIRTKRATSTAGANGSAGQPKSKYRKRSSGQRATPPGKCHSCNIRETPEWRRGPDGARTLCNACGLHYAKLMRKRDKNNGETPQIDLETLRASARAADLADKSGSRSSKQTSKSHQSEPASPMDTSKQQPLHHQNTFQVVSMMPPEQNVGMSSTDTSRVPPSQQHQSMPPPAATIPPPPWATSMSPAPRSYPTPDHLQHQSFMRSSQHSTAPSR